MLVFVLLTSAVLADDQQAVYVGERNGTTDTNCLTGGPTSPSVRRGNNNSTSRCDMDTMVCPTWFYKNKDGNCTCGSLLNGIVRCDPVEARAGLLNCYCMTRYLIHRSKEEAVVGQCFYNCFSKTSYTLNDTVYRDVPQNISNLSEQMCGHLNRRGLLCGDCKEGYILPAYSYDLKCVNCTYSKYNWVIYIVAAYVPLTVFFILIVSCRVSIPSGPLNAFVQVSQGLSTPTNLRILLTAMGSNKRLTVPLILVRILATFYGIWNLDFFRTLLPAICLNITTQESLALDYAIAVYPLILIATTYGLIVLHERNFRPVIWMWRPFHKCFARLRAQWDIRTSIIDAFSSFLLLSYVKLLSVSFDLLLPTWMYNDKGTPLHDVRLYYNATVVFFSMEHLPYAIVAITVLIVFIFLPLFLLLLYPFQCCQRCLNSCRLRTHALNTFIDTFQGCYKDGTNGTCDCRYFSAAYLLVRIIFFVLYVCTLSVYTYSLVSLLLIGVAIIIAIVKPYKSSIYNTIDTVLLLIAAGWNTSVTALSISNTRCPQYLVFLSFMITFVLATLPLVYIIGALFYFVFTRKRLPQRMLERLRALRQERDFEGSLPDRLVYPQEYRDATPHPGVMDAVGADYSSDSDVRSLSDVIADVEVYSEVESS